MTLALSSLDPREIADALHLAPFQGAQIFRWMHGKRVLTPERMTDLSKDLRALLAREAALPQLQPVETQISPQTGTKKSLFRLCDGETVEAVLIRERDRVTICVSSQVGCALQCSFCATGLAGFTRNLNPGGIVEQVLHLLAEEDLAGRTPNVVFMGMGEPFRNYENVIKAIHLLMAPAGLGIGARKITVSTAGEINEIARFASEDWQVRLSVSLHAANDALRSQLVPLNRKYPLARLRAAVADYIQRSGRQITFEWTLLDEVNDRPEDALQLVRFLRGLKATVNLIPWNPVSGLPYAPSTRERCLAFQEALSARGVVATLRKEKGRDIDAACGQLRRTHAL